MKLLLLLLLGLPVANAQILDDPIFSELELKLDEAITQTELNISSAEVASYLENQIDVFETRLSEKMSEESKALFELSGKEWKNWKNSAAEFEASFYDGGTMQPLVRNTTRIALAKSRIQRLISIESDYIEAH